MSGPAASDVAHAAAAVLDAMPAAAARTALTHCCGASAWVSAMLAARPFRDAAGLAAAAAASFSRLAEKDWLEAFAHHPKIGDVDSLREKFAATAHLAGQEQAGVQAATDATLTALRDGNVLYEHLHGFIFIVCATGKTAGEMLALLEERMPRTRDEELKTAAGEQAKITALRLAKLGDKP